MLAHPAHLVLRRTGLAWLECLPCPNHLPALPTSCCAARGRLDACPPPFSCLLPSHPSLPCLACPACLPIPSPPRAALHGVGLPCLPCLPKPPPTLPLPRAAPHAVACPNHLPALPHLVLRCTGLAAFPAWPALHACSPCSTSCCGARGRPDSPPERARRRWAGSSTAQSAARVALAPWTVTHARPPRGCASFVRGDEFMRRLAVASICATRQCRFRPARCDPSRQPPFMYRLPVLGPLLALFFTVNGCQAHAALRAVVSPQVASGSRGCRFPGARGLNLARARSLECLQGGAPADGLCGGGGGGGGRDT
jgi:hypothetical protein